MNKAKVKGVMTQGQTTKVMTMVLQGNYKLERHDEAYTAEKGKESDEER